MKIDPESGPLIVGVYQPTDTEGRWYKALAERLGPDTVVDVSAVSPEAAEAPMAQVPPVDVLVVGSPTAAEISQFSSVKFIHSTWAGPDRLANDPARPDALLARTTGGGLGITMAEYVTTAALAAHRQFPTYQRQQADRRWVEHAQSIASERTIGILGFGQLAEATASMLQAVGFNVVAWVRSDRPAPIKLFIGPDGFDQMLGQSDVVVNLLPLTAGTADILDAAAFARCKPGASVINVGRGASLNVDDLVAALTSGQINHAWLDVVPTEPLDAHSPLWANSRITITPHIAADSSPALVADQLVENIRRFGRGETPLGLI